MVKPMPQHDACDVADAQRRLPRRARNRQFLRPLLRTTGLFAAKGIEFANAKTWKLSLCAAAAYRKATRRSQKVVVITGSVGKTTATRATMTVLGRSAPRWVHAGDNCFACLGRNLVRQGMRKPWVALEVGIGRAGQMKRYAAALQPDVVVITAVTSDHIERPRTSWTPVEKRAWLPFLRLDCGEPILSFEALWEEKATMVRALPREGLAILNGDDDAVMRMATETCARSLTFGMSPRCDYSARDIVLLPDETRFTLVAEGVAMPVVAKLVGRESIRGLLAAAAVGRAAGLDFTTIVKRLEQVSPTPARMQPIKLLCGAIAICDDFKAGGETVQAALNNLADIQARRRVVVLGRLFTPHPPVGEKYAAVGRIVAACADRVVLVGWRAQLYRRGFATLRPGVPVQSAASIDDAVALLQEGLGPGDVLLIKAAGGQKLSRIALRLAGDPVDCPLTHCKLDNTVCQECPHARATSPVLERQS